MPKVPHLGSTVPLLGVARGYSAKRINIKVRCFRCGGASYSDEAGWTCISCGRAVQPRREAAVS